MSDNRRVLVTGASRGIGFEFVRQYADAGYHVFATSRDPAKARGLHELGGDVTVHRLDMTSERDIEDVGALLADATIDILICNAAVFGGPRSRFGNVDDAVWRRVLEVNLIGTMRVAMTLWPMVAASTERKIVILSSRAGLPREAKAGSSYAYRSSKAALNAAARILALDLLEKDVVVALMNPGHVRTAIGGRNAPMEPNESVLMMRRTIAGMTSASAGRFWHYDGTELPL